MKTDHVSKCRFEVERLIARAIVNFPGPWPWLSRLTLADFCVPTFRAFVRLALIGGGARSPIRAADLLVALDADEDRECIRALIGRTHYLADGLDESIEFLLSDR